MSPPAAFNISVHDAQIPSQEFAGTVSYLLPSLVLVEPSRLATVMKSFLPGPSLYTT